MSAKTMKGKQAILRYLETHRTFTAKDVATGETFSVKVKHSFMQVTGALATAWSVDEKKATRGAQ